MSEKKSHKSRSHKSSKVSKTKQDGDEANPKDDCGALHANIDDVDLPGTTPLAMPPGGAHASNWDEM